MKRKLCFVLVQLLTSLTILSQQPDLSTKRYWEANSQLNAKSMKSTFDGGYVVSGNANIQNNYVSGFVFYSDSSGQNHWEKVYTTFDNSFSFETISQLPDSGFIAGGKMFNPITNQFGGALLKLDIQGNEIWKKSISDGSSAEILISDLLIDTDTSFLLVAKKTGNLDGSCIIKMDASGNIVWQKSFEAPGTDKVEINAIKQASDNSIFVAGQLIYSNNQAGLLMRLDSIGNVLWVMKNNYPNSNFTDILIDSNHLYCRNSTTNYGEVILSSFDYNGTSLWNLKVQDQDLSSFSIEPSRRNLSYDVDSNLILHCSNFSYSVFSRFSRDGNYIDAISGWGTSQNIDFYPNGSCTILMSGPSYGVKSSLITNYHFALTRFQSFNSISNSCFESYPSQITNFNDSLTTINLIPSSSFTVSNAMMENLPVFISIDNNCVEVLGSIDEIEINDFEIAPNPTKELIQLSINSTGELPIKGYLVDALGNEVLNFKLNSSQETIDTSKVHSGIYWIKIGDKSKKVIIL